jgi:hypothetical protein
MQMPTIRNTLEYLYEISDMKKFQTSDFLAKASMLPSIWKFSRFVPEVLRK